MGAFDDLPDVAAAGGNSFSDLPTGGAPKQTPLPKREVGLGEAAARGVGSGFAGQGNTLALAGGGVGVLADAVANMFRDKSTTAAQDFLFQHLVDPTKAAVDYYAAKPNEEMGAGATAANVGGNLLSIAPSLIASGGAGGPAMLPKAATAFNLVRGGVAAQPAFALPATVNRAQQLLEAGVPGEDVAKASAVNELANTAMGVLPMGKAGGLAMRATTGGATNLAAGAAGRAAEGAVLGSENAKQAQPAFDLKSNLTDTAIGALMASLFGGRGAPPAKPAPGAPPPTARVPDWAMQRYGDVLAANGITDAADPRALAAVERLQASEARKAEMRPGQGEDPAVARAADAVAAGEMNPAAAPWVGREGQAPPATVAVDQQGRAVPLGEDGKPTQPGVIAGFLEHQLAATARSEAEARKAFTIAEAERARKQEAQDTGALQGQPRDLREARAGGTTTPEGTAATAPETFAFIDAKRVDGQLSGENIEIVQRGVKMKDETGKEVDATVVRFPDREGAPEMPVPTARVTELSRPASPRFAQDIAATTYKPREGVGTGEQQPQPREAAQRITTSPPPDYIPAERPAPAGESAPRPGRDVTDLAFDRVADQRGPTRMIGEPVKREAPTIEVRPSGEAVTPAEREIIGRGTPKGDEHATDEIRSNTGQLGEGRAGGQREVQPGAERGRGDLQQEPQAGRPAAVEQTGGGVDRGTSPSAPERKVARGGSTFLGYLKKAGGVDPSVWMDATGDTAREANKRLPGLARKGGMTHDGLVDWLRDNGYLTQEQIDVADRNGTGGSHELAFEQVRKAMGNQDVYQAGFEHEGHAAENDRRYRQELENDAYHAGIDTTGMNEDQIHAALKKQADDLALKLDPAEDVYYAAEVEGQSPDLLRLSDEAERANPSAFEDLAVRTVGDESAFRAGLQRIIHDFQRSEDQGGGAADSAHPGGAEPGTGGGRRDAGELPQQDRGGERVGHDEGQPAAREPAGESRPTLDLTGQTESQRRGDELAAKRAADERGRVERAPGPEGFTLTGSDRARDVGAAHGQVELLPREGSDAGTLYSNPFHKALGWLVGDTKAWARSLNETANALRDTAKSRTVTDAGNPLVAFLRAAFDSSSADVRAVVAKHPSETAQWVVDQFHNEAGTGRATGETYHEAIRARVNKQVVEMDRVLGERVNDRAAMEQIASLIRNPRNIKPGTPIHDAAAKMRDMLAETLTYLRDAGVDVGEVRGGYFPRDYILDPIIKDGKGFVDAAAQAYREGGPDARAAELAAKELHDRLVYGEHGSLFKSQGGSAQAPFLKGRVFGKEIDNPSHPLNRFLNHDPAEVLTAYFQRAAKRAEIARRFGDNFEHWRDWKDDAGKQHDGILTKIEAEGGQAALTKLQEYVSLAAGIRAPGVSRGALRASSIMRTWGALAFLPKATLSSLTEVIVPAMRSGNVLDAGRALGQTINDLFVKTKGAEERRALGEDLGLIAGHVDGSLSAARWAGGDPVGKLESKVLDKFFKRTGLTQWTDATRLGSLDVAQVFIRRLANDAGGGKLNTRYLAELGVPEAKIKAFADFVKSKNDGIPVAGDLTGDMGDLYRTAVRKFVSQSIMDPSAITKPAWMSHPLGAIVGQLQSFNYAFYENVIKRQARLAKEAATGADYSMVERAKLVTPLLMTPLLVAAGYAIGEARDAVLGDPERRNKETGTEKIIKAVSRASPIAPLDPLINYLTAARYGRSAAESFSGPVLGTASRTFDAARDYFLKNTETTNTQERRALKAVWDIFIEPAVNMALFSMPGSLMASAATQAAGSGTLRDKLFVEPLAGPAETKGGIPGRAGRSGRQDRPGAR